MKDATATNDINIAWCLLLDTCQGAIGPDVCQIPGELLQQHANVVLGTKLPAGLDGCKNNSSQLGVRLAQEVANLSYGKCESRII